MSGGVVDLAGVLSQFDERGSPKVVTRLNDQVIKVVKLEGEFVWHRHEATDELFLVVQGRLTIQLRDGDIRLGPGQLFVVPRGVEHCPVTDPGPDGAPGTVHAVLIEAAGTVNTGSAGGPLTAEVDVPLT